MKQPLAPPPRPTVARRFKAEIDKAASEGAAPGDLALHLTLGDIEQLKRDRAVPVADIHFADGAMTYLGVKVVKLAKGELSALHHGAAVES